MSVEFYRWQDYRCAFERVPGRQPLSLVLIHPIGVGLSRQFWQPFIEQWQASNEPRASLYNPDLLGCGDSDLPPRALRPKDWAQQLAAFIDQAVPDPVVLVVQGALLPVAVELMGLPVAERVKGLALSGPPAWRLMTTPTARWQQSLSWTLFQSFLGNWFYRYARRESFLRSFSQRQLFERPEDITDQWLTMLHRGSRQMDTRYAVFSFLAGFWRKDYGEAIARIQQPVMIVMGEGASSIDRAAAKATASKTSQERLQAYLDHFPRAQGAIISGRNVLPYESAGEFVEAVAPFVSTFYSS